jgi:hypothetical protein
MGPAANLKRVKFGQRIVTFPPIWGNRLTRTALGDLWGKCMDKAVEAALWPGMVLFAWGLVLAGTLANLTYLTAKRAPLPNFAGERDDLVSIVFPD